MTWVNQSSNFGYGEKLTSTQMQNLRDNIAAAFNKDENAPTLAAGYVTSLMVGSGQIGALHIGANAITSYHIGADAVGSSQLADGIIGEASIAAASVSQSKLKTSSGEVSTTTGGANLELPGGVYGFYPQVKRADGSTFDAQIANAGTNTAYQTMIFLGVAFSGTGTAYAQQTYITSSGEVYWIYLLIEKMNGRIASMYAAPDHPCFGNTNNPNLVQHPFGDVNLDMYEIKVINPETKDIETIEENRDYAYGMPHKTFKDSLFELFEIDEESPVQWPNKEVTIGLNKQRTESIKSIIPRPSYVQLAKLKLK